MMAFCEGRNLILILSICFCSLSLMSTEQIIENASKAKLFPISSKVKETNNPEHAVELAKNLMPMDATEGTTSDECSPGMTCGRQDYIEDDDQVLYLPFQKYCDCSEDSECMDSGRVMRGQFLHFVCTPTREAKTLLESTIKICRCPVGYECVYDGRVYASDFFFYKCKPIDPESESILEPTEAARISYATNTALPDAADAKTNDRNTESEIKSRMIRKRVGAISGSEL